MIIGNGLIAKRFYQYRKSQEYLIFASGVSDSIGSSNIDFDREELLLRESLKINLNKTIVYFSSCDAGCNHTNDSLYYNHKRNMEKIIRKNANNFYIFRLPQVVGNSTNTKTLMNFLVFNIKNQKSFRLYENTYKNILDIDDMYIMCHYILEHKLYKNETINIINKMYFTVYDIVKKIQLFLTNKAIYESINNDKSCKYNNRISKEISTKVNCVFDERYIEKLLFKYYSKFKNI